MIFHSYISLPEGSVPQSFSIISTGVWIYVPICVTTRIIIGIVGGQGKWYPRLLVNPHLVLVHALLIPFVCNPNKKKELVIVAKHHFLLNFVQLYFS